MPSNAVNLAGFSTNISSNNLLVGGGTSTGTASQPLQVTGGGYFSGSVGIGVTNPGAKLIVANNAKANIDNGLFLLSSSDATNPFQLLFSRSSNTVSNPYYAFQPVEQNVAYRNLVLNNLGGNVTIGSTLDTGTASQTLQVTGSAYVSTRIGIGQTNPNVALHVGPYNGNTLPHVYLSSGNSGFGWRIDTHDFGANSVPLRIFRRVAGTDTEVITVLNQNGNVGIGTTNPQALLQVGAATTQSVFVDTSGRLLVGIQTARANFFSSTYNAKGQIEGTGTGLSSPERGSLAIINNSSGDDAPLLILAKTRGTTIGSNTACANGEWTGHIGFNANDGTKFVELANIVTQVDGSVGVSSVPGRIIFATTAAGASSPTERMRIQSTGTWTISNSSYFAPATDNAVNIGLAGNRFASVWAVNGTIQTSDERAKTDVTTASLGSEFIKSLRPVSYKWIEGGKRDTGERDQDNNYIYESVPGERTHWGFIAQEVKEAVDAAGVDFGGWVLTDKDDPDSQQALRYDQFIAPLTKALQEAIAKIEALEAEVQALKSK